MDENIEIDQDELLTQRTEEIMNSDSYMQVKVTMAPIPPEELEKLSDKSAKKGKIAFGDFMDLVEEYMDEHYEYKPIINVCGKNVSLVDRLVALAMAKSMIEKDIIETYLETKSYSDGEDDEDGND